MHACLYMTLYQLDFSKHYMHLLAIVKGCLIRLYNIIMHAYAPILNNYDSTFMQIKWYINENLLPNL